MIFVKSAGAGNVVADCVGVGVPAAVRGPALTECYYPGNWVTDLLFLKTTYESIITSKSSIKKIKLEKMLMVP